MNGPDTSLDVPEVVTSSAATPLRVVTPRVSPEDAGPRVPRRLRLLLAAGCVDSVGYAFGWTVFLLLVAERHGVAAAAAQTAAMLGGVALAAPFSAWLTPRVSPRAALRLLAAGEAAGRLALFLLLLGGAPVAATAAVNVVTAAVAWSGFAAMRAEVAIAGGDGDPRTGRFLTWYAGAIGAVEALAAAGASLLLATRPPAPVVAVVAVAYVASLVPQWLAAAGASAELAPRAPIRRRLRAVLPLTAVGAGSFVLAAGPALFAVVLAYDLYGPRGVAVSSVAFATGALLAARFQTVLARIPVTAAAACAAGAVMVGGWSVAGLGLAGLAAAQVMAGLAQSAIEGELDRRIVGRLPRGAGTAGLALASSSMALGGALGVSLLGAGLDVAPIGALAGSAAIVLAAFAVLAAALGFAAGRLRRPRP